MTRYRTFCLVCAALLAGGAALGDQQVAKNGSMESGDGPNAVDPQIAANWTEFGVNVERSPGANLVPVDGEYALKAFGDGTSSSVGAFQEVTGITPGQSVSASVKLYARGDDKLRGSGEAGLVLEFLNLFGGTISSQSVYPLNDGSPADTWITASVGPLVAPANTARIRVTCRLRWTPGDVGGAAYWDDAVATVNSGPNRLLNGDFETAGNNPGQSSAGIDDWTGFNDQEKSGLFSDHGDFSLQLGTTAAYSGLFQTMSTLNEGDRILLKANAYIPMVEPLTGNTRAGIKLEFAANTQVPPAVETLPIDQNTPTDSWELVTLNAVVPDDVTIARMTCIYVADAGSGGEIHMDSAFAERSGAPGVNQLMNESFEGGPGGAGGIDDWTEFNGSGSECQKSCFVVPALDGDCTARATGTAIAGLFQEITVAPGETLTFTVRMRNPSFAPLTGGTTKAGVKIEWRIGGVPDPVDIGIPNSSPNTIGPGAPIDTWVPLYLDYTMPPGTSANARYVLIIEKGNALSGVIYFDSIEAVVIDAFNGSDVDGDADEDMHDFARMQNAANGAGVPHGWPGTVFDADSDGDLDYVDLATFVALLTGP